MTIKNFKLFLKKELSKEERSIITTYKKICGYDDETLMAELSAMGEYGVNKTSSPLNNMCISLKIFNKKKEFLKEYISNYFWGMYGDPKGEEESKDFVYNTMVYPLRNYLKPEDFWFDILDGGKKFKEVSVIIFFEDIGYKLNEFICDMED